MLRSTSRRQIQIPSVRKIARCLCPVLFAGCEGERGKRGVLQCEYYHQNSVKTVHSSASTHPSPQCCQFKNNSVGQTFLSVNNYLKMTGRNVPLYGMSRFPRFRFLRDSKAEPYSGTCPTLFFRNFFLKLTALP